MAEKIEKVDWDDSLTLGVSDIDSQHKKLVQIINELYDISSAGKDKYSQSIENVMKKLIDYTIYHFSYEEEKLEKLGYMNAKLHKSIHEGFVSEIQHRTSELDKENIEQGLELYKYLVVWLFSHIGKSDRAWAKSIQN